MELLSVIRRWALRDQLSIGEIARRTGLSRNTIRNYLRGDVVEPVFKMADRRSKLDARSCRPGSSLRAASRASRSGRSSSCTQTWSRWGLKVPSAALRRLPIAGRSGGIGSSRRPAAALSFRWSSNRARLFSSTGVRIGPSSVNRHHNGPHPKSLQGIDTTYIRSFGVGSPWAPKGTRSVAKFTSLLRALTHLGMGSRCGADLHIGAIARERGNRYRQLVEQRVGLGGIINIVRSQFCGDNLARAGAHSDMQLPPGTAHLVPCFSSSHSPGLWFTNRLSVVVGPLGGLSADPGGDRHAETCHPVEHVAPKFRLGALIG